MEDIHTQIILGVVVALVMLVLLALVEMHVPQPLVRYKLRVSTGEPALVRPAVGSSITAQSIGSGGSRARF
jgi:hypothetical protein